MGWIDCFRNYENNMYSRVCITKTGINNLCDIIAEPSVFESILYGDVTEWLSSLVYIPLKISKFYKQPFTKSLVIGKYNSSANLGKPIKGDYAPDFSSLGVSEALDVGEVKIYSHFFSYLDYEPYTTIEAFLPYYGYLDLPTAQVIGKTISFKLGLDYSTGQAIYYVVDKDDDNRIITKVVFQLGFLNPISSTGVADMQRNIALSAIHGLATVASSGTSLAVGLGTQTTTTVVGAQQKVTHHGAHQSVYNATVKRKNPATNRMGIYQKTHSTTDYGAYDTVQDIGARTSTRTYDHTNQIKQRIVSGCFETAGDVLTSLHFKPSSDNANNPMVDRYSSKSIYIVITRPKVVPIDADYLRLYGKPAGDTYYLGTLKGYTEISNIHLEGEGFAQATEQEIATLYDTLAQGFIL